MQPNTGKLTPDLRQLLTLATAGLLTMAAGSQANSAFDADAVDTSSEFHMLDADDNQRVEWRDIEETMKRRLEAADLDVRATFEEYDSDNDNALNEQEFNAFIVGLREAEYDLNRLSSSDPAIDNREAQSRPAGSVPETSYGSSNAEGGMGSTAGSAGRSMVNSAAGGEFVTEDTSSGDIGLTQGVDGTVTRAGSPAVQSAAGGEFQADAAADSEDGPPSDNQPSSRIPYITEGITEGTESIKESAETGLNERPANYQSASGQSHDANSAMQSEPIGQAEYTSRIPQDLANQTLDSLTDKQVHNSNGDRIGKVDDVVANLRTGKVGFVVSSGGMLGIGKRHLLVPVEELATQDDDLVWNTGQDRKALRDSHTYESDDFVVITEQYETLGEVQPGGLSRR